MKASTQFSATLVATIAAIFAPTLSAHDDGGGRSAFATDLSGYQETPATINSVGAAVSP